MLKQVSEKRLARQRAVLTKEQVLYIFRMSLTITPDGQKPKASFVAKMFRVNEKTIRDIWTGRTWSNETSHLDSSREPKVSAKLGRPLGRKDGKP